MSICFSNVMREPILNGVQVNIVRAMLALIVLGVNSLCLIGLLFTPKFIFVLNAIDCGAGIPHTNAFRDEKVWYREDEQELLAFQVRDSQLPLDWKATFVGGLERPVDVYAKQSYTVFLPIAVFQPWWRFYELLPTDRAECFDKNYGVKYSGVVNFRDNQWMLFFSWICLLIMVLSCWIRVRDR